MKFLYGKLRLQQSSRLSGKQRIGRFLAKSMVSRDNSRKELCS